MRVLWNFFIDFKRVNKRLVKKRLFMVAMETVKGSVFSHEEFVLYVGK